MNIQLFFPTVICSILNEGLAEEMLPIAKKYLNDETLLTNAWGYKNTYSSSAGIEHNSDFLDFINVIKNYAEDYLKTIGYNLSKSDFQIHIFTSEMKAGDRHNIHTHQNCILSGVFYLQVPEGSSCIKFYDPRPFRKFISYPILKDTEITCDNVIFTPEKGLLLLWESWIEHEVLTNSSQEGRITLVFNITKK